MLSEKALSKRIVLLVVIFLGILITAPSLNYQDYLSQGDHGRDLYAAQAVYRGDLPYKDFWWVYGPLSPYYYGIFFKIFGTHIGSMILGKLILRIIGGILVCLGMLQISSELAALFCACWFMLFQQDFFFTYNHIAGIVMLAGVVFCLLSYIKKSSLISAFGALGFVFALCLIKINFGIAALMMAILMISFKNEKNKIFYLFALIILPLIVFLIYYSLLKGLSINEIRQCLPYMDGDQPYTTSPWDAIISFLKITLHTITSTWTNFTFAVIINASVLRCLYLFSQRKLNILLPLSMLAIFYAANSHEYIKSGVWYRLFWAQPLSIMMAFLCIDTATQSVSPIFRKLVFTFLAIMAAISWFDVFKQVNSVKNDAHYIALPRAEIYTLNEGQWIDAVDATALLLDKILKPNELFFALPYDCLYYYLTDRKSPTRQLIFFEHIKIPPIQEKSVIAELEKNHVNYVLVSSRAFARQELGLGFLGTTYCPLIGKYIQNNFTPMAKLGDWKHEPGWAWNHGTLILRRKGT